MVTLHAIIHKRIISLYLPARATRCRKQKAYTYKYWTPGCFNAHITKVSDF